MAIISKLPNVGTTIFTTMSALATEHQAVNLGQGFPDFPMPEALRDGVSKALRDGFNQYAPMPGYGPLREKLAEKAHTLYGAAVDPNTEITITPGGTYAIYTALTTLVHPGDEVIVFEPAYDSYIPNIEINGGVAVTIPLTYPEYRIDWEEVKRRITAKTKAIVLNSPHNPTGTVLTDLDIVALRGIVASNPELYIVSDEVYEHLIFDYFESHCIISDQDRKVIFHPNNSRIQIVPNGIDASFFQKTNGKSKTTHLLFTGNMS